MTCGTGIDRPSLKIWMFGTQFTSKWYVRYSYMDVKAMRSRFLLYHVVYSFWMSATKRSSCSNLFFFWYITCYVTRNVLHNMFYSICYKEQFFFLITSYITSKWLYNLVCNICCWGPDYVLWVYRYIAEADISCYIHYYITNCNLSTEHIIWLHYCYVNILITPT